ncbi:lanC-like protein 2 [Anoplophora glabripennis]|uniref:lanC-like protein 2 n=1 Tax=Anoplophora glabripennis TaxID=217634 RepID=UPI00087433F5|nr:lanC-like protein 2 [Anoplophora glabripennis]
MPEKYFRNPFDDYSREVAKELIENNLVSKKCKISCNLSAKWQATLNKCQCLDYNDYSVYTGTSGIALLKLRKDPDNVEILHEAKNLLSLNRLRNRRHTFLCGDAGPLSIGIVVNHKLGNNEEVKQLAARLKSLEKDVLHVHSDLPNEYLYGRAGYLFAILYANKNVVPPPFDDNFIRSVIEAILICGQNMAKAGKFKCPLMYQWHDSYYLGAAHGLSGILYLLLQVKEYLTQEELDALVKPTIDYLITQRFPSGNFPSSLGRDSDKYVQWCHGAPGFLYLFTAAYKAYHDSMYLQLAQDCGDVIWERGLLKKGYSICHGVSGNAYCFLELYQTTKEEKHLYRAIKFAEWCLAYSREHEEHPPDRPLSLYEGIAGPMYLLLDIQKPMEAKFPGFTL